MKYVICALAIFSFLVMGCAHKSSGPAAGKPQAEPPGKPQTPSPVAMKKPVQVAGVDARYLDDRMDFLDEETEASAPLVADPIKPWNKLWYHFNDKFYLWLLEPAAKGYKAVAPEPVRTAVKNFFHNVTTPIRLVNSILQWKGEEVGNEFNRFLLNTTVGILGFWDPAKKYGLKPSPEDLGQTLGSYGIGNGFYIVWPILGPCTARDTFGFVGDAFLNPVSYVEPTGLSAGITAYKTINNHTFHIGDYQSLKDSAIDPYEALRDAYIQHRQKKVAE